MCLEPRKCKEIAMWAGGELVQRAELMPQCSRTKSEPPTAWPLRTAGVGVTGESSVLNGLAEDHRVAPSLGTVPKPSPSQYI